MLCLANDPAPVNPKVVTYETDGANAQTFCLVKSG
jgi:hypothetical protein